MSHDKFDDKGRVICQICGKSYKLLAHAHMKKHGIKMEEYREQFPDYPVSSKEFQVSQKFRTHDIFKSEEEPKPITEEELALLDDEDKQNVSEEELYIPEEPVVKKQLSKMLQSKHDLFDYLKIAYPGMQLHYEIKRQELSGYVTYHFITDMADPTTRIVLDFPKAVWHTAQLRPNKHKNSILSNDGWKIIEIEGKFPSIDDVKKKLDILD